jgi:hypothetical protein
VRLRRIFLATVLGALVWPVSAGAATVVGKWDLGSLLDVQITKSGANYTGRALNKLPACGVSKNEAVWKFKGAGIKLGTATVATFPGGVCYGFPKLQAAFFLRDANTLRLCIPNNRKPGAPAQIDSSSAAGHTHYPCADYKRIVKKNPGAFKAFGSLEYYLRANRNPVKRCPSTGPQTYNVFFKEFAADPMMRIDTVTLNGKVPEVYDGGLNQGHISVPTTIFKKTVVVDVKFTTDSGRHLGFRVTWPPCVPD